MDTQGILLIPGFSCEILAIKLDAGSSRGLLMTGITTCPTRFMHAAFCGYWVRKYGQWLGPRSHTVAMACMSTTSMCAPIAHEQSRTNHSRPVYFKNWDPRHIQ
eukprot:1941828-Amphidinium_carterae.1